MKKESEIAIILLGFGLSYAFFGLSLILPLLPEYSRIAMGITCLGVGTFFFFFAGLNVYGKK